ncbi:HAMP domain-containing sensor histidine kinase [Microbacterium sp. 2FI]|uniref:sensor histidine kinase n=1 Tax=Microbacterium sp. 2FI TaxID=2502193 RepID=UPI0020182131|nr:HAMP domain-containing sensor histidine kinase [Microbacterium sp. 2FI]
MADVLRVVAVSAGIAVGVGLVAWVVLRRAARAPIAVHLVTIVVAAVASVTGGVLVAAQAMYLSEHDARIAITIAVTSGVVAVVAALLVGSQISRSARMLRGAAEDLGNGIPVEVRPIAVGEFRAVLEELAASDARLTAAREQIAQQEVTRRDLVTRITHDLRVPLAGIRAQAEALQDGLARDPERYIAQIVAQTDRVDAMVSDLFAVSQIDAGTLPLRRERVSLADVASDAASDLRPLAEAAGVELDVVATDPGTVEADAGQLARAVANLLANALQHTPAGGGIRVDVSRDGDAALLVVGDDGPGFAAGEVDRVFEAGWRGDTARSPHRIDITGAAGLGLAIVRGIARAHGGEATAGNGDGGGARVAVRLPLAG